MSTSFPPTDPPGPQELDERDVLAESGMLQSLPLRVLDDTPLGVIIWDRQFRVAEWNKGARHIFGWERKEVLKQHAAFIIPVAIRPLVDDIWRSLLQAHGGSHSINTNLTRDGRTLTCEWHNTPLRREDDTVVGVALGASPLEAYDKAHRTDPTSAFGGIIAFNRPLDAATARAIVERQFVEVIRANIPVIVCILILVPVMAWDAIRFTHRLVGPMVRFRATMQAIARGEPVRPIKLRDGDYLDDLRDDFNKMLEELQKRGVPVLKPADPAKDETSKQTA